MTHKLGETIVYVCAESAEDIDLFNAYPAQEAAVLAREPWENVYQVSILVDIWQRKGDGR